MPGLIKYDPISELQALHQTIQNQLFSDDWFSSSRSLPTTDIYTKNNKLNVEIHLPNFDEKDIDVNVDGDSLVIQAEHREKEEDKDKKYVVRESSSSFYRRIRLPESADLNHIDANMKDGVLKVSVPVKQKPEPKKITIKKS
jgi:HSP20 family protein